MLRASIVRIDGSPLLDDTEIQAQRTKRGPGEGNVWRGSFSIPTPQLRPTMGETIELRFSEAVGIPAVVTEIAGGTVHFRAPGPMPRLVTSGR